jgi:hypothetical protein
MDDHLHRSAGFGMKGVVVTAGQIKVSPYGRIASHFMGRKLRRNVCASELKLAFYPQFQIPFQVYEDDCRHQYDRRRLTLLGICELQLFFLYCLLLSHELRGGKAVLCALCYFGPLSQLTFLHSCCSTALLLRSDSASINVACGTCPQMNPSEWFLKFAHFWESFYSHSSTVFPWVHLILWCTSQIGHYIGFSQSTCESYSVHHPSFASTLCFQLHYVECTLLIKQCHWATYEPTLQHPWHQEGIHWYVLIFSLLAVTLTYLVLFIAWGCSWIIGQAERPCSKTRFPPVPHHTHHTGMESNTDQGRIDVCTPRIITT